VWTYATQGHVSSSPAVYEGVVYVGSWDHKVYALGTLQASTPTNGVGSWAFAAIIIVVLAVIIAVVLVLFRRKATRKAKTPVPPLT
jgi:serine/threonine-protein kinase